MAERDPVRIIVSVLPREFRERVFEPAYCDLMISQAERRPNRVVRVVLKIWLIIQSFGLGLPHHVWHRGRFTRLARYAGVSLLVAGAVIILLVSRYAEYPPAG